MDNLIKKAIIPIAGLGTRFLPLTKAVPKEFLPLVDKPIIQYIVEELKASGINEIIFVTKPNQKAVLEYFKKAPKLEKILKHRKKHNSLGELKKLVDIEEIMNFSSVAQKEPLGDGHAILQAKKMIKDEPVAVLFPDDVVDSKIPCILQLTEIYKTCQKPVVGLFRVPKNKIPLYGIVEVEKIANRVYKIKKIIEKPSIDKAPSDLAIVGRYIHTPEVFDYLKKTKIGNKHEIIVADVLNEMLKQGKTIYGYEIQGEWRGCGDKLGWIKANTHFSLKHPEFGSELKKYLKTI
ncbi:MAG: UTP--glucose-1-phosphate uridylyltransferase [Patescibacteria group bacterium]|nr:UTP--glucose-1-phosphate uridylyltransferase [Patescibacteria group bacterium]